MPGWGFFEWLAYGCFGIGAVVVASDQAIKLTSLRELGWAKRITNTNIWAFIPFVMLLVSGIIILVRAIFPATDNSGQTDRLSPPSSITSSVSQNKRGIPRYYSSSEKEDLANRISNISVILNRDLPDIAGQWGHMSGAVLENFPSKKDVIIFLDRLDLLYQKTKALDEKLWIDAVNGNPDFSSDLRDLIGGDNTPLSKLETSIQNYRNAVEVVSLIFDRVDNEAMVKF